MKKQHNETLAIRTQIERTAQKEHSNPLFLTSSFSFDSAEEMAAVFADEQEGNMYSRYSNPNVQELIDKAALLEGAETGWATASGMAAVFTTFAALLQAGDHIVSSRSVFGSTHRLFTEVFPKWGIMTTYVDALDYEGYEKAITKNTKILYLESPSNPALEIIDLEKVGKICQKAGVLLMYAEVLNELGQTGDAYEYVDLVRARVGMHPLATAYPAIGNDKDLFRNRLKVERVLELCGESVRWADLKRWGDLETQAGVDLIKQRDPDFNNFQVGKHIRLPLPQIEVENNTNLTQNPMY